MKAALNTQYGPPEVVHIGEVPAPAPRRHEILVKVIRSAVTVADSRIRGARFPKGFSGPARLAFGIRAPRNHILGSSFSGVVEAVGADVTKFAIGDEVAGMSGIRMGAHAEYVCLSAEKSVVKKPKGVSHDEAAGILFGATAALYFIRDVGHVAAGQDVLVNGASGAVGNNAVQLATHIGARVTGVTSGDNEALVRSLGADEIINYETTRLAETTQTYDVVLDTVGNIDVRIGLRLLRPKGLLLLMVASLRQMFTFHPRVKTGTATEKAEDIAYILDLVAQKKIKVLIDSTYSLDDIATAHARVDSGKKNGAVILRVSSR